MPVDRFYLDSLFQEGQTVSLTGDELDHLFVMRKKANDTVELVNGKNQLAICKIEETTKSKASLLIEKLYTSEKKKPSIILAQALPKMPKLELVVEKGVELEVSEFWFFPGMHSEIEEISENKKKRLEMLKIAAMKQCGRLDLPKIVFFPSLDKTPILQEAFFGDINPKAPGLLSSLQKNKAKGAQIFIGPEKGFHEQEIQCMIDRGAMGVCLLDTVLRTETAAICASSLAAHFFYLMNSAPNMEPL